MRGLVAVLALVSLGLPACVQETYEVGPEGERRLVEEEPQEPRETQLARPHHEVSEIVSGDTIVLEDGRRIRYAGVAAPESGEKWFDECRRSNEGMVRGRRVVLDPKGQQNENGTVHALVWVEMKPEDIVAEGGAYAGHKVGYIPANWAIVRSGSGKFVDEPAAGSQLEALRSAESVAKSRKLGVWQD